MAIAPLLLVRQTKQERYSSLLYWLHLCAQHIYWFPSIAAPLKILRICLPLFQPSTTRQAQSSTPISREMIHKLWNYHNQWQSRMIWRSFATGQKASKASIAQLLPPSRTGISPNKVKRHDTNCWPFLLKTHHNRDAHEHQLPHRSPSPRSVTGPQPRNHQNL